jgi:hypothetical protein
MTTIMSFPDFDEMSQAEFDETWHTQNEFASFRIGSEPVLETCVVLAFALPQREPLRVEIRLPAIILANELRQSEQPVNNAGLLEYLMSASERHPREMMQWYLDLAQASLPRKRSILREVLGLPVPIVAKWWCLELMPVTRTEHVVVIEGAAVGVS